MYPPRLWHLSTATLFLLLPLFAAGCGSESSASDAGAERTAAGQSAETPRAAAGSSSDAAAELGDTPEVLVYKASTCGCCEGWVEHLEDEGFEVEVEDRDDMIEVKNMLGIPGDLRSCHTAVVGKYLVEGHVPASDVRRLLAEEPQVAGLATPGMPVGSPGMEVPGRPADRYDVLTFDADGRTAVFESH